MTLEKWVGWPLPRDKNTSHFSGAWPERGFTPKASDLQWRSLLFTRGSDLEAWLKGERFPLEQLDNSGTGMCRM